MSRVSRCGCSITSQTEASKATEHEAARRATSEATQAKAEVRRLSEEVHSFSMRQVQERNKLYCELAMVLGLFLDERVH